MANELVKFLAVNTEFQSVKDLHSNHAKFKEEIAVMKQEVVEVAKSNQTTNNKVDQLKYDSAALSKRVKALKK